MGCQTSSASDPAKQPPATAKGGPTDAPIPSSAALSGDGPRALGQQLSGVSGATSPPQPPAPQTAGTVLSPSEAQACADGESVFHDVPEFKLPPQQTQLPPREGRRTIDIVTSALSLWRDRDGDVAHEFWVEDIRSGMLRRVAEKDLVRVAAS